MFVYVRRAVITPLRSVQEYMRAQIERREVSLVATGEDEIAEIAKATQFFATQIASRETVLHDQTIELSATLEKQELIANENARLLAELKYREAGLRVTFDNITDAVARFDQTLSLVAWNSNFQKLLELPDAFLAGNPSYADYVRFLVDRGEFGAVDLETELHRYQDNVGRQWTTERILELVLRRDQVLAAAAA